VFEEVQASKTATKVQINIRFFEYQERMMIYKRTQLSFNLPEPFGFIVKPFRKIYP